MDLILKTQSISLCHREELIIVDVSDILQNWKNYCNRKFSVTFTESQFELFKLLYNQKNFKTISLLFGKKLLLEELSIIAILLI